MTDTDDWIALALAAGIGPVRCGQVLRDEVPPDTVRSWLGSAHAAVPAKRIAALRADCAELGMTLLSPADADYPLGLRMIADPPPLLFLRGDSALLAAPQIAVVGARRASRRGLADAAWLARDLAAAGLVVTSGLALGIDAAAHHAVLEVGGRTVAVLGSSLDRVYPARHRALAARIAEQGLLVSEFPPGTAPAPHQFPRRNRVISGLALGVVVVEAAEHSGSLITARLAATQGREVFALPATARDPGGAGCHRLIREGARLVTSVADVLEELPIEVLASLAAGAAPVDRTPPASAEAPRIAADPLLALLDGDGTVFDALLARSGLDAAALNARLFELELEGLIGRERERWIRLR